MNILKDIVVSVAQRAILKMLSERGGAIPMDLSEKAIGLAGRSGIQKMEKLGLLKLTPLVGQSERYDVALTDLGRNAVTQVIKSMKGG